MMESRFPGSSSQEDTPWYCAQLEQGQSGGLVEGRGMGCNGGGGGWGGGVAARYAAATPRPSPFHTPPARHTVKSVLNHSSVAPTYLWSVRDPDQGMHRGAVANFRGMCVGVVRLATRLKFLTQANVKKGVCTPECKSVQNHLIDSATLLDCPPGPPSARRHHNTTKRHGWFGTTR
jgi:hypothetical protein